MLLGCDEGKNITQSYVSNDGLQKSLLYKKTKEQKSVDTKPARSAKKTTPRELLPIEKESNFSIWWFIAIMIGLFFTLRYISLLIKKQKKILDKLQEKANRDS